MHVDAVDPHCAGHKLGVGIGGHDGAGGICPRRLAGNRCKFSQMAGETVRLEGLSDNAG